MKVTQNCSEFIAVALNGSTDPVNIEEESYFVSYLDEDYEPWVDFVKIADGFFATFWCGCQEEMCSTSNRWTSCDAKHV